MNGIGRSEADLDSGEVAQLQALVNTGVDRATEWGQNLLCFGYGICRPPLTGGDDHETRALHLPTNTTEAPATPELTVFPNPANSYTTLVYDLKNRPDRAYLVVRDITGRELQRFPVTNTKGQQLWDTRQALPGTYAIELRNADTTVGTAKVVVKP